MKIKRISDQFVRNFKMRLCHVSDTHGHFPRLYGRYDTVIHTGDFFPNSHHVQQGNKVKEAVFQMRWLEDNITEMKQQLQGHPYLFILGNHDFVDPQMIELFLNSEGVQAIDLTDKLVSFGNVNFYGFPYVPAINGMWNYEREVPEMQKQVEPLVETLNKSYVDILACHSALHKVLDLTMGNEVIGSSVLSDALDYKISKDMQPAYYLHGHVHEAHGMTIRNGMVVSNAATAVHIIEV